MTKKKVLIISPVPTHPHVSGNRARVFSLGNALVEMGFDVYFLHIDQEQGDDRAMQAYWGERFIKCPYTRPKATVRRFLRRIYRKLGLQSAYRYAIDEWYDPAADEVIARLHENNSFDVVIVEYVFMSKALENFHQGVVKAIDTHDVFSDRHRHYLRQGEEPSWFSTSQAQESKALARSDKVIAIQNLEAEFFRGICDKQVVVVGHNADPVECPSGEVDKRVLIVASTNKINIQAVEFLVDHVMPEVVKAVPDAHLAIAGSICTAIPDYDDVLKLGIVDDLSPVYCSAAVVANPVSIGTGLKIKSIEALAHGRPLVTTEVGAEGLEQGAGQCFYIAGNATDFAGRIIALLNDVQLRQDLSDKAYELIREMNARNLGSLNALVNDAG